MTSRGRSPLAWAPSLRAFSERPRRPWPSTRPSARSCRNQCWKQRRATAAAISDDPPPKVAVEGSELALSSTLTAQK
eukprot:9940639-Alexandrium_andersonii.AAC.1